MVTRRALLSGAAVLGASLTAPGLSGCSGDSNALTFFFQAAPAEARVRRQIIEAFGRLHPEIEIRVQLSGPDPQQQILTYCAGGKCPDILMQWESYSRFAALGVLQDLNVMLDKDPAYAAQLRGDSTPNLYETFTFQGGQYVLPEQWAGIFLYYNRKLFDEAGLKPPPARWRDAWTFAEFLATAQALTERDASGRTTRWGFVDAWPVPRWSAAIFGMNNGAAWFTPAIDPTRTNIDDDRFIEGFQFYTDLSVRHRVAPQAADLQAQSALDLFMQGKAAMVLTGHWQYSGFLAAPDLDFDVTVLPVGPQGQSAKSDVGTTGLAIAASSAKKDLAWEFVKFATGPAGQRAVAESGLFVPALQSARRSPEFVRSHTRIRNLEVLIDGPDNSNHLPVSPHWPQVDAAFTRFSDRVLRGAAPASWFKDGPAAELNRLLQGSV
ncbi:ABC transporter substrate-binding protein [Nocardia brasiliensis]|uniref:Putative sugar-binding lipoprotein n=1 Tax=Nocardia brasiliensis (strain ATCC 700358 / HUJEG-1) TaxID=1133849 RepID=K0F8J3_NOCB7|nr:sugar ABC transporter substrate-binding protein [Nocardia brasiliensis]AFU03776.1 putative sugar-binding lipoprotein [Nocardia brasiliensis ATCC 700358]OCF89499.1 ABC transporter [Nocardia brasiliensis]